jgi:hypothetical protein
VGELQPEKLALGGADQSNSGRLGLAVHLTPEQRKQLELRGGWWSVVSTGRLRGRTAARRRSHRSQRRANRLCEAIQNLVDKAPDGKPVALLIQRGDMRMYVPVTAG